MKTRHGVLWDMDGVLTSSGEFHFQAWSQTLGEYDIPFSRQLFQSTFGMNNAGILETLLGETPAPELVAEISELKEQRFRQAVKGHVRPLPGVPEWLERLQGWGVRQAIASSAPPANIDALVDELGIRPYFTTIVSGNDLPGKPAPALFLQVAEQLAIPPRRCVVFEDAVAGVEAAKRAGMKCVAVTTTNPADALNKADLIVERLDALTADQFKRLLPELIA
ncbi:MAG: HAD family phosphatase [Anaerolineae bacterium]|nr:MAG: HAD family phosphatase [Anaerolineae bacterium]